MGIDISNILEPCSAYVNKPDHNHLKTFYVIRKQQLMIDLSTEQPTENFTSSLMTLLIHSSY